MREAKLKAYDDLYTRVDSKKGEKKINKLAKIRERKIRDFNQVKCIKSEDSKVFVMKRLRRGGRTILRSC